MGIGHCGGYIVKIGSLLVFQDFEVHRSSGGVQGILRNSGGPLTEVQVTDCA